MKIIFANMFIRFSSGPINMSTRSIRRFIWFISRSITSIRTSKEFVSRSLGSINMIGLDLELFLRT